MDGRRTMTWLLSSARQPRSDVAAHRPAAPEGAPEVDEQDAYPTVNVVADRPEGVDVLALRVLDLPVLVPLPGEDGAGLPAAQ